MLYRTSKRDLPTQGLGATVGRGCEQASHLLESLESRVLFTALLMSDYYPGRPGEFAGRGGQVGSMSAYTMLRSVGIGDPMDGVQTVRLTNVTIRPGVAATVHINELNELSGGLSERFEYSTTSSPARTLSYPDGALSFYPRLAVIGTTYSDTQPYVSSSSVAEERGIETATTRIVGFEQITLPIGTFTALRIEVRRVESGELHEFTGYTAHVDTNTFQVIWAVLDIGLVRSTIDSTTSIENGRYFHHYRDDNSRTSILPLGEQSVDGAIQVSGRGVALLNNSTSPTTVNGSSFGGVDVDAFGKTRVFVVRNTSSVPVTISGGSAGVSVSGQHASEFYLSDIDTDRTIQPGGAFRFRVRHYPGALGFRYATIRVSLDAHVGPFAFVIRGTGIHLGRLSVAKSSTAPEVYEGSTPQVALGTAFGALTANAGSSQRSFSVFNSGAGELRLQGTSPVSIEGEAAGDFVVTLLPSTTIGVNGSSRFTIRFRPTTSGVRKAVVRIITNDPYHPMFTFNIQGTGR